MRAARVSGACLEVKACKRQPSQDPGHNGLSANRAEHEKRLQLQLRAFGLFSPFGLWHSTHTLNFSFGELKYFEGRRLDVPCKSSSPHLARTAIHAWRSTYLVAEWRWPSTASLRVAMRDRHTTEDNLLQQPSLQTTAAQLAPSFHQFPRDPQFGSAAGPGCRQHQEPRVKRAELIRCRAFPTLEAALNASRGTP